jgi:hypothetical protein
LAILKLLLEEDDPPQVNMSTDPFTLNLALAFLSMGITRCDLLELEHMLPRLLVLLPIHSGLQALTTPAQKSLSHQVAHLILFVLERMLQI